jgi:DNA topoisomerase-1
MNLVIVESPTKARTLGKFLGSEYDVEATMGHVKDLPKSRMSIDIDHNFEPQYEIVAKRSDVINSIKSRAKKAKKIYLATDPDREGEAISAHIKEIIGDGKTVRIVFHEITKEAVEEALKNPRDVDKNLVDAQIARRVLDRLVGYELSPLLWKKVRRGLSAGRVQSVAVRLIVEKEREIEKFKPDEYWEIFTSFPKFTAQLVKEIKNKKSADEVLADLKTAKFVVSDVRKKEVTKSPYPPFTTSTMSQAGARLFGWSAKRTMRVAQSLYEEGLITYHRTDSLNLSASAVTSVRSFINKEYGDKYVPEKPRFFKTHSKNAQEAHEAIRPTNASSNADVPESKFRGDGQKLYDLIRRRFIASQMTPAVYSETAIDVAATPKGKKESENYLLRASGQVMIFDGWRKLFTLDSEVIILPEVNVGEVQELKKVWGEQKFTLPPARYNEASLIKTLEKLGIGRPSTYAPIITTIQVRQYVEKNEGKFFATNVGIAVTDFLTQNFDDIVDYAFTAEMEDNLDRVANGEKVWTKEMGIFWKPFKAKVDEVTKNAKRVKIEVEKLGRKCPECKEGELVIRIGRFGKFISCSRFPDCRHTEKLIEKIGMKCPECKKGDVIIKKSRKGRNFFGCSRYPDCKWASWKNPKKEENQSPEVQSRT